MCICARFFFYLANEEIVIPDVLNICEGQFSMHFDKPFGHERQYSGLMYTVLKNQDNIFTRLCIFGTQNSSLCYSLTEPPIPL